MISRKDTLSSVGLFHFESLDALDKRSFRRRYFYGYRPMTWPTLSQQWRRVI